jgi:hypothetical protein
MSTSGSTNFSITRDQLIAGALRLCGVLAEGETATATQVTNASEALNMLVKRLEADGMPLWAIKQSTITMSASTNSYNIGIGQTINTDKPLKVIQAFIRDSSNNDTPMRIVTRQEYNVLGNKASSGRPIQVFYEPLNDYGVLHIFPTPSATDASGNTLYIVYQRPFEDFDASTDNPDFPQEWYEVLKYQLAARMAGEYQLPIQLRQQIAGEAKDLKDAALSFGTEEGSLYFGVDSRGY